MEGCAKPIICAMKEELDCEAHFVKQFTRLSAGDCSDRLPAKFNLDILGESYQVSMEDSYFPCILWRDSPPYDLCVFNLQTVTLGTKPAFYLAVMSMHQLSMNEVAISPVGAEILHRDIYVDNLIYF